jgi:hypothetical protein
MEQLEFHGHYSKYKWEILSSPRTVRLLTRIAFVGSWVSYYLLILAADADAWASHYFLLNETCFPKILESIKQQPKSHKNMNNSYLDI